VYSYSIVFEEIVSLWFKKIIYLTNLKLTIMKNENSTIEKKHLAIIIALLALCFGAYVFFNPPVGGVSPNPIVIHDSIFINKDNSNNVRDLTTICVDCMIETDGQTIPHLKNVLTNYRKNIWDSINNTSFFGNYKTEGLRTINYANTDARAIWFPLETLKQFICTIENNNAQLKIPATNLGIRFYYAQYEHDYTDRSKQNMHTLFMLPTYRTPNGDEVDFDPRETVKRQKNPSYEKLYDSSGVTFNTLLTENASGNFLMLAEGEKYSKNTSTNKVVSKPSEANLIKNNGELCPVNCPTTPNGNTLEAIDR
jgi:hypothetical protein